ncbi:LysE family translocator [Psychrobacter sp. AOP22-C1-C5]|uniref:LysE family translocator n=1 Tax=Psychrobacter sp. AOP22-C1-C5 TaxID=3457716 RepID=UPI004036949C
MFGIENYLGFILAAILLNLTPGTDSVYIITRSISQGQKAGLYSVLGITSGSLIHTLLASLGLSVLLASSPVAFMIVKYIGAAYLCYLGLKMLLNKPSNSIANSLSKDKIIGNQYKVDNWQIYKQGVLTNVFNPKVALFFIAFFPQFIDANYAYGMVSFLVLGLTFASTGFIWCSCLALLAARFSKKLRENPSVETILNKISGVVFIGLGIKLLTEKA